jgi:Transglutaminase-like superfamily
MHPPLAGEIAMQISADTFCLASHVHVCVTRDGAVFLDLKRDKYFGVGREDSELLSVAVDEWPNLAWDIGGEYGADQASEREVASRGLCESLVDAGLLSLAGTGSAGTPSTATDVTSIDMKGELVSVGDELEVNAEITVGDIAKFVRAFAWARYSLRFRPLLKVVESVRARKLEGVSAGDVDIDRMANRVSLFRQLRCWVFAPEGRCLLHALTLVNFLSAYGLYPEWVFGVRTQPWAAHSWAQLGHFLLDSNPEKVSAFTPILVV